MFIENNLLELLKIFPDYVRQSIQNHPKKIDLIEIIIDIGRRPEARFRDGFAYISNQVISWQDLEYCLKRVGKFTDSNRAGIERTLHRISCIRNRQGKIIGLTCRFGRSRLGTISILHDLIKLGKSLLILGPPGVGKTTAIREISRVLSDELNKRVIIIDTSNEIAGDNDVPHSGIGKARRMQVKRSDLQHRVMIEAVENHMPQCIVIDEIGTELEALAARTIAERGVQLVGTAHGNSLENLIKNPTLTDLIGGIQAVTLGDDEAKRRQTQKSIVERKYSSTFQIAVEIKTRENWVVHMNVEKSVDFFLQDISPDVQLRYSTPEGNFVIYNFLSYYENISYSFSQKASIKLSKVYRLNFLPTTYTDVLRQQSIFKTLPTLKIFISGIGKRKLSKLFTPFNDGSILTDDIKQANVIILIRTFLKFKISLFKDFDYTNQLVYVLPNLSTRTILPIIRNLY